MHSRLVNKCCILTMGWGGGGGLFDYSVKPGPHFVKVKARFVQVGD